MALQLLLASIFLFFLVNPSTSTPVSTDGTTSLFERDSPDLNYLQAKWKGIYFADALNTCSSEQFDTLVKTLDQSHRLLLGPPSSHNSAKTPGWNRFFLDDHNVGFNNGWSVSLPEIL
jgi:hypothetical protein